MRSQTQGTHRYFTAIASVLTLVVVAGSIAMLIVPGPTPEWALISFTAVVSIMWAVAGFVYGVTLSYAKQCDREALEKANESLPWEDCG